MYKDAGFKVHERSDVYVNAMFAWGEIKKAVLSNSSVSDVINDDYRKKSPKKS